MQWLTLHWWGDGRRSFPLYTDSDTDTDTDTNTIWLELNDFEWNESEREREGSDYKNKAILQIPMI